MVAVAPRPASGGALLYVRCFWTAAPPPIGGNCTTRGFDTPATLRKRASCSAKPPSPARRTPGHGGLGRTAHERCQGAAPSNWHEHYARARHYSPNNNHAGPLGYKTLPAHPPSPHIRYKTLPAHPKWLDLALFLHAGRVLYRSHHQEAEQGEFCTDCEAELGLATTARHALLVRKAPEEPGGQAAAPVDNGTRPRCGLRPVGRTTPRHPWAAT